MLKRIDLVLAGLIASVTVVAWGNLLNLSIRGDGFVYLIERLQGAYWRPPESFAGLEVGSVFLGKAMTVLFGPNITGYFLVELITIILINILFFYMVKVVTGKRIIAFAASLFLSVNYFGNWEMYAGGIYAYFMDRVPDMLFLIPSFAFLHLYLEKQKIKYYTVSLALYFFGVFIAHWSFIFTGLFLFYPFFWFLFEKKRDILKGVKIGLPFFFITVFFAVLQENYQGGLGPEWSFREFVLNPGIHRYPEKILRQLTYWSAYTPIIKGFDTPFRYVNTPVHHLTDIRNVVPLQPYVILAYLVAGIATYKLLPKFRHLLATIIFTVASMFFLNAYIGQYQIFTEPGSNRYLYPPTFLLVIFWTLFLYGAVWRRKQLKLIFWFVLVLYLVVSLIIIRSHFDFVEEPHTASRRVWDEIVKVSREVEKGTTIVIPAGETGKYEAEFLNDQIGRRRGIRFLSSDIEEAQALEGPFIRSQAPLIEITYDKECACAKTAKSSTNR